MERVFMTNHKENGFPIVLRTWKSKGPCKSRLDNHKNFSMPFEGRNKHPDIGIIKIVEEITNTDKARRLLFW